MLTVYEALKSTARLNGQCLRGVSRTMRKAKLHLPDNPIVDAAREALDSGIDVLSGRRERRQHRKSVALAVLAAGAVTAIPIAMTMVRRRKENSGA